MLLTLDAGNSRIKAAVFENNSIVAHYVFRKEDLIREVRNIISAHPKINNTIISSVADIPEEMISAVSGFTNLQQISYNSSFPFINKYATPLTLGIDRMVLAAGAVIAFPQQNRLVIDAGTCITYDFVDEKDNYLGGAISPGLKMRYEAMHHFTAKLPLLEVQDPENLIGNSSANSMHSGSVNGVVYEIDGFISESRSRFPNFTIILTGGDAEFLAKRLKNTIFANSNFLLESLNHIFSYTNQ